MNTNYKNVKFKRDSFPTAIGIRRNDNNKKQGISLLKSLNYNKHNSLATYLIFYSDINESYSNIKNQDISK